MGRRIGFVTNGFFWNRADQPVVFVEGAENGPDLLSRGSTSG
jgi:hypothetical protein